MISFSFFLYSSVLRNITEIYSSIPKLRKVLVTDERRAVYSLINRWIYVAVYSSVNRWIYRGQPTKVRFRTRRPKTSPRAQHHGTLNTLFLNCRRRQHSSFRHLHLLVAWAPARSAQPPPRASSWLSPPPPGTTRFAHCLDVPPAWAGLPPPRSAPYRAFSDRRLTAPSHLCPSRRRRRLPAPCRPPWHCRLPRHHEFVFYLNLSERGWNLTLLE
jgi:hypothetical protein